MAIVWAIQLTIQHLGNLWILVLLRSLNIGVKLVHERTGGQDAGLTWRLYEIIREFNEAFGIILVGQIFNMLLISIIFSFQVITLLQRGYMLIASLNNLHLLLNSYMIFALCDASTQLDQQVKQV